MAPQMLTETELRIAVETCDVATLGRAQSSGQDIRPPAERNGKLPALGFNLTTNYEIERAFVEFQEDLITLMILAGAKPLDLD